MVCRLLLWVGLVIQSRPLNRTGGKRRGEGDSEGRVGGVKAGGGRRDGRSERGLLKDVHDRDKVTGETWTNKGQYIKRLDIKGRGRAGIKHHPTAKLHLVLREGKTQMEKQEAKFRKELSMVRSAGQVREDGVLRRKVVSGWAW